MVRFPGTAHEKWFCCKTNILKAVISIVIIGGGIIIIIFIIICLEDIVHAWCSIVSAMMTPCLHIYTMHITVTLRMCMLLCSQI